MKVGELNRWNSSIAAMWPDLVVILIPDHRRIPCLLQCFKPALIEEYILELSGEIFEIAVLHWTPQFNQNVTDAIHLRPRHEHSAGELWYIIRAYRIRIAPEHCRHVQQPGYIHAWDNEAKGKWYTLKAFILSVNVKYLSLRPLLKQTDTKSTHNTTLIDLACLHLRTAMTASRYSWQAQRMESWNCSIILPIASCLTPGDNALHLRRLWVQESLSGLHSQWFLQLCVLRLKFAQLADNLGLHPTRPRIAIGRKWHR